MRANNSATATAEELLLDSLRADTPGVEHVVHFNNAGCGLLPRPVLAAIQEHLELEATIGGYEAAAQREAAVRGFYSEVAALLNAEPGNIAFASSATHAYSTALSAIDFAPGDVILTTRNDFVSNQIAFLSLGRRRGVEVMHAPDLPEGGVDVAAMAELMRKHRPRLVAATHVPTNSGLIQPVAEIGRHCRELDLLYLVDACQSVGQLPIDVQEIGCDFLTATPRKFLRGPRGTGFLYVSDRVLRAGHEPQYIDMYGAQWDGPDSYQPVGTAARFEDWEFPYAALLGCAEAVRYARAVGIEAGGSRSRRLAGVLRDRLRPLPGVTVLDQAPDPAALVTFSIDGWESAPFKAELDRQRINSALSFREFAQYDFGDKGVQWCLRLSPHYYNTKEEVELVAAAVGELATRR
ncbi:aminotransferase class V-fold PLP-dependent enzyme [Kribbella sp. NPDC050124]|uniref:aminotransferase class V-fold PLP-dependent enzyme n=1 Tax=Kribbella sp. NPDC050124 TaxID=3364114 RepID=UPI0037A9460E